MDHLINIDEYQKKLSRGYILKKTVDMVLDYMNFINKNVYDGEEYQSTKQLTLFQFHQRLEAEIQEYDKRAEYEKVELKCQICNKQMQGKSCRKYCDQCRHYINLEKAKAYQRRKNDRLKKCFI